jgi:hypothetical protein
MHKWAGAISHWNLALRCFIMWHICSKQELWSQQRQLSPARQWLSIRHLMAATDTCATIEKLLEGVLSVPSVPRLHNEAQLPWLYRKRFRWKLKNRKCVCDGRQPASTWARKQRNVHCWKTLSSRAVKTVTENTSLCVIVICKVYSWVVC